MLLREESHEVSVEFDINDSVAEEAVALFGPDLIIAPFLKRAIPESIWKNHLCLIVHPGIRGDRGPSSLDWAILSNRQQWGVTLLQANAEMDAGDIWSSVNFPMRPASKASLYRHEVTQAAVEAVLVALERYQAGTFTPTPLDYADSAVNGCSQPAMPQAARAIDWQRDTTATILRKIRSADGVPGVKDTLFGQTLYLYDAREEGQLRGAAGEVIARSGPAICRTTIDGAIWLGHLRDPQGEHPFKLPATMLLAERIQGLQEIAPTAESGYRDIWYHECGAVGYLHFEFYNGAMSTTQCQQLLQAYVAATARSTSVLVLMGGADYWSNGIHLNVIEAAESAADASWENINAIDDLAEAIITTSHITVAALQGGAGAGGVFLARACDEVWAHNGVIINPHYKDMGNLYGSEYWSYLLPRVVGDDNARLITQARLPMGMGEAHRVGLVDRVLTQSRNGFVTEVEGAAAAVADDAALATRLKEKGRERMHDEAIKPLQSYREEELAQMQRNFYGFDPSYHVARYNFVYKVAKSRTPLTIASHRRTDAMNGISP